MINLFLTRHFLLKELTLLVSSFKTINKLKKWDELKTEFDVIYNEKLLVVQIIYAVAISGKEILRNYSEKINNLVIQDYH